MGCGGSTSAATPTNKPISTTVPISPAKAHLSSAGVSLILFESTSRGVSHRAFTAVRDPRGSSGCRAEREKEREREREREIERERERANA